VAEHHDHHHHAHEHPHHRASDALGLAALLTIGFALVEGVGGWWTGSLALLSDAGHMLTDSASLGLGALAAWMARQPPSRRHSYGLGRAEVVAALVNAAVMLGHARLLHRARETRLTAAQVCWGMPKGLADPGELSALTRRSGNPSCKPSVSRPHDGMETARSPVRAARRNYVAAARN